MAMVDAALEYIKQGFKVFPVKLDKTPYTVHGLKDATETQAGVKEYWNKWPDAGIGMPTDLFIVLDFDAKGGGAESLKKIEDDHGKLPETRVHRTGGGGLHFIYRNPNGSDIRNTVEAGGYKGLDIRANGGYIVMPPSLHSSGKRYLLLKDLPIADAPLWVTRLTGKPNLASTIAPGQSVIFHENTRNQSLTRLAGSLRRNGMSEEAILIALLESNKRQCDPPLNEKEVARIARSAAGWAPSPTQDKELSQSTVTQWIALASGNFNVRQIWNEIGINTPEDKTHLRMILHRLSESGVIAKTSIDGTYRKLNIEKKPIHWENANPTAFLPIVLPFDLHNLCKVYPKSIIIVAGSKNEGKTAFLTSCVMPNVENSGMVVDFFNSESGAEQLNERFSSLGVPSSPPFDTYERYDNFADVIEPDRLSIIDYLDLNSELYLVGAEIDAIFRKLTTGCVIIGLQKPPPIVSIYKGIKKVIDRDLAYGGGFTAKRAAIYISLSSHRLKLVYVKTPANPKINPNNMVWSYDFDEKGNFTNIQRYSPGLYD